MRSANAPQPGDEVSSSMIPQKSFAGWYRNRFVWVAAVLAVTAGAVVLTTSAGSEAEPADLQAQILTRMRTTLEHADPGQHNHADTPPSRRPPGRRRSRR